MRKATSGSHDAEGNLFCNRQSHNHPSEAPNLEVVSALETTKSSESAHELRNLNRYPRPRTIGGGGIVAANPPDICNPALTRSLPYDQGMIPNK